MLFKKNGVTYVKGHGKLTSKNDISVDLVDGGTETLKAKNIMLATGSEVTPFPGVTVDQKVVVDSTGALSLDKVPEKLVVIGGGVIGLELGSVWSRLGSKVTVVEFMDSIAGAMNKEPATAYQKILKKQGMKFMMSTKVTQSEVTSAGTVKLTTEPAAGGDATELECDITLVSTGRRPFTSN